ncbi:MAG: PBECR2 nuclease fold domain-containing protein [Clostridia bacterium]
MNIQVGKLNQKVIKLLNLEYKNEIPIILGNSNIEHMKRQHPSDYERYGHDIEKIINSPTYVAKNPKQDSIEYIKEYKKDNKFVLVAVRVSNRGNLFARTLFTMTDRKKNIYLNKGYAKKYK